MSKQDKQAAKYTRSVWSGKKYSRPQTAAELAAESMRILRAHPGIRKCLPSSGS
jgi:hypothetical protein